MNANHEIPDFVIPALREVESHAREFCDIEVCGLIVDGQVVRGMNALVFDAPHDANKKFVMDGATIDALDEAIATGHNVAIYHSHVHPDSHDDFSPEDMTNIYENGDIPWLLVDIRTNKTAFKYLDPAAKWAYEEREWRWSCVNCYSLVRDWLRFEMGIHLDPFVLQSENAWTNPEWNEFLENLPKQGFVQVDAPPDIKDVKTGDLILSRIVGAVNPNHIDVVVDAAHNKILRQLQGGYSTITSYGMSKRKATVGIYRHRSLMRGTHA
jgi:proteasome lid subunit RPN8/RPN11